MNLPGNNAKLRPFRSGDEPLLDDVCVQTGDSGRDATASYRTDPRALGRIYVGPYLAFEPDLALVLEDNQGVCGYVLGALDSRAFYDRYLREWLPPLQQQFPEPEGDPAGWLPEQRLYFEYHHPRVFLPPDFQSNYPSHMHIDLMPRAQGKGYGRPMVMELLRLLRERGSPGVHLGMAADNERAGRFYRKLGFVELARNGSGSDTTIYMGLSLMTDRA